MWDYNSSTSDGAQSGASGHLAALKDARKNIMLEVYNEAGQHVQTYNIFDCWVSEYQALPSLDAGANVVIIQHIKLEKRRLAA